MSDPTVPPADANPDEAPDGVEDGPDRRPLIIGGAIVGVILLALLGWFLLRDDGDEDVTTASTSSSTSTSTSTTASSTSATSTSTTSSTSTSTSAAGPTALTKDQAAQVIWPDPGGTTRFATPTEAASSFATSLAGFQSPVVEAFQQGDSRSGEVPIKPVGNGPTTTVMVRQVGSDASWWVIGAATEDITVTEPARLSAIDNPMHTTGTALAFEGTVQVKIVADGSTKPLGEGFVTGGGGPAAPFSGDISFTNPGGGWGSVLYYTVSEQDGSVWSVSAVRVGFIGGD